MKDLIASIVLIVIFLIGLPLLIVYLKDRGGLTGIVIKRVFGGISLFFGIVIIGWVIYNIFRPTEVFKASYITIFQFATPIALVCVGWHWLTGKVDK